MAKMSCLVRNHKTMVFDNDEYCITCLENEIERLRAYVQRGSNLLHSLAGSKEIDEYRERAGKVLLETLNTYGVNDYVCLQDRKT